MTERDNLSGDPLLPTDEELDSAVSASVSGSEWATFDILRTGLGWALGTPLVLALYVAVILLGTVLLAVQPLLILAWVVLFVLAGGITHCEAARRARDTGGHIRGFGAAVVTTLCRLGALVVVTLATVVAVMAIPLALLAGLAILSLLITGMGSPVDFGWGLAVGLTLASFPALYIAARLSLSFPAVVLTEHNTTECLARSWDQSRYTASIILGLAGLRLVPLVGFWVVGSRIASSTVFLEPTVLVFVVPLLAFVVSAAEMALASVYLSIRV